MVERRVYDVGDLSLRVVPADGEGVPELTILTHHAPPWEVLSAILWYEWIGERRVPVHEVFHRGAFTHLLPEADVRCLREHSSQLLLGRTVSGTLVVEEDEVGLRYEATLPSTVLGDDVRNAVDRGDLRGSSFAFGMKGDEGVRWELQDEMIIRHVERVDRLYDVGPVAFPAYEFDGLALRASGERRNEAQASLKRWLEAERVTTSTSVQTLRLRQRLATVA